MAPIKLFYFQKHSISFCLHYLIIPFLLFLLNGPVYSQSISATSLPDFVQLDVQLEKFTSSKYNNGGMFSPNRVWVAVVDREGKAHAVVKLSGQDNWPAGRILAFQKANTANSFSNDAFALSTANLYKMTQPGGSMFGIQNSIPLNPQIYLSGKIDDYGTQNDHVATEKLLVGGISTLAGGLPLYNQTTGKMIGAIGVCGDSPCADQVIAWRIRYALGFTKIPAGPNHDSYGGSVPPEKGDDNIIFNEQHTFGYPDCNIREVTVTDLPSMSNFE